MLKDTLRFLDQLRSDSDHVKGSLSDLRDSIESARASVIDSHRLLSNRLQRVNTDLADARAAALDVTKKRSPDPRLKTILEDEAKTLEEIRPKLKEALSMLHTKVTTSYDEGTLHESPPISALSLK